MVPQSSVMSERPVSRTQPAKVARSNRSHCQETLPGVTARSPGVTVRSHCQVSRSHRSHCLQVRATQRHKLSSVIWLFLFCRVFTLWPETACFRHYLDYIQCVLEWWCHYRPNSTKRTPFVVFPEAWIARDSWWMLATCCCLQQDREASILPLATLGGCW